MEIKNLEEYKRYIQKKLEALRPLFAKAAIGDFSENAPSVEDDDDMAELYTGIQTMIEVVRQKIADFESEVGQRQQLEQRLIDKNKEQGEMRKALLNVLEDLKQEKERAEAVAGENRLDRGSV